VGGLGLTTQQVGLVYGTIGIIALTLGGLAGGYVISRFGLKRMLWPMIIIMHAPIAVFLYLAAAQPEHLAVIGTALAVEQFGYGFGFTAYMVYMMMVADGEHKTAHYALCTGFMALGMMLPGMAGRLDPGPPRLPAVFPVGLRGDAPVVRGDGVPAGGPGVREKILTGVSPPAARGNRAGGARGAARGCARGRGSRPCRRRSPPRRRGR
jgi:hypothetical protein